MVHVITKKSTIYPIAKKVTNIFFLWLMDRDQRYKTVKVMIETGNVTEFQHMFNHIPKSVVAHDLGTNNNRMTRLISRVEQFTLDELHRISKLVDIDFKIFLNLAATQMVNAMNEKKNKKK
jgi:plasmid maintenance system antidote protein VapI